jgi:hypothetical protein
MLYFVFYRSWEEKYESLRWSGNVDTWKPRKFICLKGWNTDKVVPLSGGRMTGFRSFYINNEATLT